VVIDGAKPRAVSAPHLRSPDVVGLKADGYMVIGSLSRGFKWDMLFPPTLAGTSHRRTAFSSGDPNGRGTGDERVYKNLVGEIKST
jgi:hypothetical protein